MSGNIYEANLPKTAANYQPLSPIPLLQRAAAAFPKKTAVIHGENFLTYAAFYRRALKLASALSSIGIGKGDTVAIMAPNTPPMLEAHYGVPMTGAVLNTLNLRLDAASLAFILQHGEAKVLITDTEYSGVIGAALDKLEDPLLVIDIDDPLGPGGDRLGNLDYEAFLAKGEPNFIWSPPSDEWDAISLNYTSGTTGNPKGVVYHHRGAFLLATGNLLAWDMPKHATYLWTLPMFHCNGWCFTWSLSINASTHVCLRDVNPESIFAAISQYNVTHLCGAPVVLNMIANSPEVHARKPEKPIYVATAAAPPPAAVIAKMEAAGFHITHLYGLTETYGPSVVSEWNTEWNSLSLEGQAAMKARQGIRYQTLEGLMVANPETLEPVPADGSTMGEVFFRGNVVMKGYLKNPAATKKAFADGWFHSGDLGVMHEDGYIELKDRSKDIIISGGENISTIEVEAALYQHPKVFEAAVVARPNETWGETPCAFVTLKENVSATEKELIEFCRDNLAHYKIPKTIIFGELPKTSTGKVQKFLLRERARNL